MYFVLSILKDNQNKSYSVISNFADDTKLGETVDCLKGKRPQQIR